MARLQTMGQFAGSMAKRAVAIEFAATVSQGVAASSVLKNLVHGTPVDKGVARSNWIVTLDSPSKKFIRAHHPGSKLGISERANAETTIALGNAVIKSNRLGRTLYITNNTPYILKTDRGSATQSARNFIAPAIKSGIRSVKSVRLL